MSRQKQFVSNAGFTILETLIVLATAGLILLFVFQAIPQLSRNSRNNQRKQDVSTILQAVSRYELNNSGRIPTGPASNFMNQSKLNFYNGTSVNANVRPASQPDIGPHDDIDSVDIYNHYICSHDNIGVAVSTGAGFRDVVALYAIETSGGGIKGLCQEL